MDKQNLEVEVLEIDGLEYDVGGVGAGESNGTETNYAAHSLVAYRLPIDRK